jgi:hypothetical protein
VDAREARSITQIEEEEEEEEEESKPWNAMLGSA